MASQSSPPPPPLSSSSSSHSRPISAPFVTKTYQLVDDASLDPIISWNQNGTAFVVWNTEEFARDVLPNHFKHNNFSSFVRQLNTYGFRKVEPDRWEFAHDCFRVGVMHLLRHIVRRGAAMKPCTSNISEAGLVVSNYDMPSSVGPDALLFIDQGDCGGSSSCSRAHLLDENDRLKKKNTQLCKELTRMNSMCTNIYSMMSGYNHASGLVPGLGHGPGPPPTMLGAVALGYASHNSIT